LLSQLSGAFSERYTIERELGVGGMATVYLAEDTRHRRKVAVKVLHPELSAVIGGERFLKEIELTASLQHPHILPLFDSGESEGQLFYVMPFLDGETLRRRLDREKQLPIADALRIASEVADALEYAHKRGIVHRDIKPENILLHEGRPMVADFGIALAVQQAGGERMTQTGMSLGTPQYMAPEQAMGEKTIDHRADIYALGAVTYEMLTGEAPFTGPSAQAIVAKVVTTDPTSLVLKRRSIPLQVEQAVLTALEKMPADRFTSAGRFAEAIAGAGAPVGGSRVAASPATAPRSAARWRAAFIAASALAIIASVVAAWALAARSRAGSVTTWQYIQLSDTALSLVAPSLAISPDGQVIVFRPDVTGGQLHVKQSSELPSRPLPGTDRGTNPSFSPDGEWVVFVADGRLKKVRLRGGGAVTIADSTSPGLGGAAWLDDGTVIYIDPAQGSLRRIHNEGGSYSVALDNTALPGLGIGGPRALPGSRGVLFQVCTSGCVTVAMHMLDLRTGQQKLLLQDAVDAMYLPTGHLLYVRLDGSALVAPFDLDALEISGGAVQILDGVVSVGGWAPLAVSRSGTLVYLSGSALAREDEVVRISRDGRVTRIDSSWTGQFNSFALSPDGRHLAVGVGLGTSSLNVWVKQLERGPLRRLSFSGRDRRPFWSPDGRTVGFIRDTLNTSVVVLRSADGTGAERRLTGISEQVQQAYWSPDGRWIVVRTDNSGSGAGDIVMVPASGDGESIVVAGSPFTELHPAISPDGRWIAYASLESGRREVYVRPTSNPASAVWQVSNGGGDQPRWSRDGRELYFISERQRIIAVRVTIGDRFEAGDQELLFAVGSYYRDGFQHSYDVTPSGEFVLAAPHSSPGSRPNRLVRADNWFREVRARTR
jgi:eukaryotic-like serine/threonine-protein kinase